LQYATSSSFELLLQNSSPLQLVTEVLLEALTTKDPDLRYLEGKDVQQWVGQKQKISDPAFFNKLPQIFQLTCNEN
jgi:hypothetical protein